MKVGFKIWLEDDRGNPLVGEGLEQLLEAVAETGSINKAAEQLQMSYRTAWARIRKAEKRLGCLLVSKQVGGAGGGGSRLTKPKRDTSCWKHSRNFTGQPRRK